MTDPSLISERVSDAIERFAKEAERAQTEMRGDRRIDATRRYAATRAALSARELAILDMTALKRRTLADLAAATRQSPEALTQLLIQAGERLADHYEAARGGGAPPKPVETVEEPAASE